MPVLCVFDVLRDWFNIAEGTKKGNRLNFNRIGTNVVYLPAYYASGQIRPVNYPFFVDTEKKLHFFYPSETTLDSVVLLPKAGFQTPRNKRKQQWVDSLANGMFQGSNDLMFKNAQTLATIDGLKSTHPQFFSIENIDAFRYVRFVSKHESYLALLVFFDKNGNKIPGTLSESSNVESLRENGALDNSQLTFSGGKKFTLVLELNKPSAVVSIRFQVRNDGNHIDPGDTYSLFYWDKEWKTLTTQTASDTFLVYRDIPGNALLWLRNTTKGKEENVFIIDENGKQHFLGFCN